MNKKPFVRRFHARQFQNLIRIYRQFQNLLLVIDSFGTSGMFLLIQASPTETYLYIEVIEHSIEG